MLVNALFLFILFRCGADIISPEEKGALVVAVYVAVALVLTATKVALSGTTRRDLATFLVVFSLLIVNLLWVPAAVTPQLYFSVTILLPITFLLFMSSCEPSTFIALRKRFLTFGMPVLCGFVLFFFLHERGSEGDLLTTLNEQPFHVVAQTIAKASILLINQWIGLPVIGLIVLAVINVRSALLGFLLAFLIKKYNAWSLRTLLVVLLVLGVATAILLNSDLADAIIQRVVYRDREPSELELYSITSGRDQIWSYYGQMLEKSSVLELLFGRGAIWLYDDSFPLAAHNDLLNLMVSYGLAGTLTVAYAWYVILSRLDPQYRMPCVAMFVVLFFTNGVVFHQSNLLFVLFMAGKAPQKQPSGIWSDEVIRRSLPARG